MAARPTKTTAISARMKAYSLSCRGRTTSYGPVPRSEAATAFFFGRDSMPYASIEDLPPTVRTHLPPHAQDIFRAAFNSAWEGYGAREPWRREEIAHRVAWAAV